VRQRKNKAPQLEAEGLGFASSPDKKLLEPNY